MYAKLFNLIALCIKKKKMYNLTAEQKIYKL